MATRLTTSVNRWVAAAAVIGVTAGVLAAGLLWMVLTRPIDVAEAVARFL